MEKIEGISGLTKIFRESISSIPDGSGIVFLGSEAVCPPFAQLLAYSVRDRGMNFCFAPKAVWENCRRLTWADGAGFQIGSDKVDPSDSNVIVVLGGLAIPKFGCEIDRVNAFIHKVNGSPLVVGLGFMDVFRRSLWDRHIHFDVLIDAYMSAEVLTVPSVEREEPSS